ncbi:MAG: hypothetical protein K2J82_00015 [Muribaculaceae bacterium]|nr:hypothetical protein [Muribaculaceae bacterium]
MYLEEGFYLYINYDIINHIKFQTIRVPFEISKGRLIESSCIWDYEDDYTIVYQNSTPIINDIRNYREAEIISELNKLNTSYCVSSSTGTFDSVKDEFVKLDLNCGQVYKNIYRPLLTGKIIKHQNDLQDDFPEKIDYIDIPILDHQDYYTQLNQLELLLDELYDVFKVIAPCRENLSCFGNKIRNILILACTEIDSIMKRILEQNEIKAKKKFYTTNDYIKLSQPLRLNDYSLSLYRFEELGVFNPFIDWNSQNPTLSLPWYNDYNTVKHDRNACFHLANLKNAINSIISLSIIIISQYGYRNDLWKEKAGKVIKVNTEPKWSIRELYVPRRKGENFSSINFPFNCSKQ